MALAESIKPAEGEAVNPSEGVWVETDASGQEWTCYPGGGRLKRGGTIGPGRPTKEVREMFLRNAENAAKRDAKILASELPDDHSAVESAKGRAARFGLGTSDETVVNSEAMVSALGEAIGESADLFREPSTGIPELIRRVGQKLNLKGS